MANNIRAFRLLFICLCVLSSFKSGYCRQTNYFPVSDGQKYFDPPRFVQYSSYAPQEEPVLPPPPKADTVLAKDTPPPEYAQDAYFAPIEGFSQLNGGATSNPGAIDYQPDPKTITGANASLTKPQFTPEYPSEEEEEKEEEN